MGKGFFISVEGTDGSGKSTQLELIREYFKERKIDALFLREPGGTAISEKIRNIILDKENDRMAAETEALLYAASRAQLVKEVISPAIEAGKNVVCDRFLDSSIAYQSYGRGLGFDMVFNINSYGVGGLMPDITLFFDLPPEKGILRKASQQSLDRLELEGDDFRRRVYKGYVELCERFPTRIKRLDASLSIEEVFESVKKELSGFLR